MKKIYLSVASLAIIGATSATALAINNDAINGSLFSDMQSNTNVIDASLEVPVPYSIDVKSALDEKPMRIRNIGGRIGTEETGYTYPNSLPNDVVDNYYMAEGLIDIINESRKKNPQSFTDVKTEKINGVNVDVKKVNDDEHGLDGKVYIDKNTNVRGYESKSGEVKFFIRSFNEADR